MSFERDNIRRMSGYASGEQPEDPDTIKLNTNENPYPPAPGVQNVLSSLSADVLRRYPPATAEAFRKKAAALHGVEADNIIATRGGDELLRLVITTFVDPGETIGMTSPTYSLYPVLAEIQNCPTLHVPLDQNWCLSPDFADQMNRAGVKLTLLVNPHAPSGKLFDSKEVDELAAELDGILLLDEAYIDFAEQSEDAIPLIHKHRNLIILRTLSKGYSLAGLRFGYGIGDTDLIQPMLTKTRDSYNLDAISQAIAIAAIDDQDYAAKTWSKVKSERSRLATELANLTLLVEPSETNFLLVTIPESAPRDAADLYHLLKERHILVRYFTEERLQNKLRITVGTAEENDALLIALKELLH